MSELTPPSLFRTTVIVGIATILAKAVAFGKDVTIAAVLGRGDQVEAYIVALLVPSLIVAVITGGLAPALAPVLMRLNAAAGRDRREARALVAKASGVVIGISAIVALLLIFAREPIVAVTASGFDPLKQRLTMDVIPVLAVSLVFSNLAGLWSAALMADRRLILVVSAPAAVPLALILAALSGVEPVGAVQLGWATLFGSIVHSVAVAFGAARRGYLVLPTWRFERDWQSTESRSLMIQYMTLIGGSLTMALTGLVDTSMGAALQGGSVAALDYGARITMIATALGAMVLGTTTLPHFAELALKDRAAFFASLRRVLITVFLGGSVGMAVIAVFGDWMVSVVFVRGTFTANDAEIVAAVNFMFAFQIPFYLMGIVLGRAVSAIARNDILLKAAGLNVTVNVVLNVIFIELIGVAGIALATSLMNAISVLFVLTMLRKSLSQNFRGSE